jgi:hypothetical protein
VPFETDHLVIRELREEDLEAVLPVYTSNPAYLALTEGSGGEPGRYELDMLERDFVVAQMAPGRTMAGIFLKGADEPIGVLDWMEENPADRKPWVGLLIIRADHQRRGCASERSTGSSNDSAPAESVPCARASSSATREHARSRAASGLRRSHRPRCGWSQPRR